ncbi:ExbD/TolR family protein [Chitinophaga niabensis]|uniref:Biopolymer transport protein ExbD n=1 Tax=Chitinophaga niabensis TaxID=536979 RepID=A0A1N6JVV0_9BACT|nr:biopolymer transporter ExbD [Chitinophaga niabensis]SIO48488.1 Biopolymer transport protein ExbD [Chitinophaga niabensis]
MAEMNTGNDQGRNHGGHRSKKLSTRVDMTPMVDLGFLLITFFMLTTTMAKPKVLNLIMPADGAGVPVGESKALTLLVGENNVISWYDGQGDDPLHPPVIHQSSFSPANGIGEVIRAKQKKVAAAFGDPDDLVILIKATKGSSYRNMVDALDEMKINRVARYALVDITEQEVNMLDALHP